MAGQKLRTWKYPRVRSSKNPIDRAERAEAKQLNKLEPPDPNPNVTFEEAKEMDRNPELSPGKDAMRLAFEKMLKGMSQNADSIPEMEMVRSLTSTCWTALLERVPRERWIRKSTSRGKVGTAADYSMLYAWEFEVQQWGLPSYVLLWLENFGGWQKDRMVGQRKMSFESLKAAAYQTVFAVLDMNKSKNKAARLLKMVKEGLEQTA